MSLSFIFPMKNREALEVKNLKMLEQRVEEVISALRLFFDRKGIQDVKREAELIIILQQGEIQLEEKIRLDDLDNVQVFAMEMLQKKPELINEEVMLIRVILGSNDLVRDLEEINQRVSRELSN